MSAPPFSTKLIPQKLIVKESVDEMIDKLPTGDVKKLQRMVNDYRLRVGDLRVLFSVENNIIIIKDVLPRGQAYKRN